MRKLLSCTIIFFLSILSVICVNAKAVSAGPDVLVLKSEMVFKIASASKAESEEKYKLLIKNHDFTKIHMTSYDDCYIWISSVYSI